jgi:TolB-like protein
MLGLLPVLLASASAGTPPAGPSVLVLPISLQGGLSQDDEPILTGALTASVRAQKRFARVTSTADIRRVLDLERQRQLLDCGDGSCLAELGGALGVDYVLSVTVGRLGGAFVVNASLLEAGSAVVRAATSRTVEGDDIHLVVRAFDPVATILCDDAELPFLERTMATRGEPVRSARGIRPDRRVHQEVAPGARESEDGPSGIRPWHGGLLATLACALPVPLCAAGTALSLLGAILAEPARLAYYNSRDNPDPLDPVNQLLLLGIPVGVCSSCLWVTPIPWAVLGTGLGGAGTTALMVADRALWNISVALGLETRTRSYQVRPCRGDECDE